jgi:riboflavin kinase/FMN adenylyltransferase
METVRGHRALSRQLRRPAVAIGNFDGVHRGHLHIFAETRRLAQAAEGEAVVLTFEPHPAKVLAPRLAPSLITSLDRKLELIAGAGIEVAVIEPFDQALAALSPVAFADQVLVAGLGARAVCVGHDFTFGARRSGTVDTLATLGHDRGFSATVVPPVSVDGMLCSSTKVREFVLEGRVEGAAQILGRPVELEGVIVRGAGRGRTIGVPTANLAPTAELLPRSGVYAGWAELLDGDRRRFGAAINVGTNPTFDAAQPISIEAHLIDAQLELYGRRLRLTFLTRLRDEQRFPSREALTEQIHRDIARTRVQLEGQSG